VKKYENTQHRSINIDYVYAVGTTATGDTFIGYFLAEFMQSNNPAKALPLGCQAA
jgi:sugar/nucleoside kinase (ribokinase family)